MNEFNLMNQVPIAKPEQKGPEAVEGLQQIHRGVWADRLNNGQELPLGGSLFNQELTTKLQLDFASFDEQLDGFTEGNIKKAYNQSQGAVKEWLKTIGSDIDPYTYFLCYQVQQKVHKLLAVDPDSPTDSFARQKMYQTKEPPKLSELKGKTECAERAALGQYLLQRIGTESAYVSGITMQDITDVDEYAEDHSFITLKHPAKPGETLIFDIARPRSQHTVPRVLETDVPFTYDLLKDKKDLLIGATEVLQGGRVWFGVGDPVAGQHNTIETA